MNEIIDNQKELIKNLQKQCNMYHTNPDKLKTLHEALKEAVITLTILQKHKNS